MEEALSVCQTFGWNLLHAHDSDYQPRRVAIDTLVQKELENREAAGTIRGIFRLMHTFFLEEIRVNKELANVPEAEAWRRDAYTAANEAKVLIEQFTQGQSLDPVIKNMRSLFTAIQNDDDISKFFSELREYLERPLKEPEVVNEHYYEKGNAIISDGLNYLEKDEYKETVDTTIQQLRDITHAIEEEPELQQLVTDLKKLNNNFYMMDDSGNKRFNADLFVEHMRSVIIPVLVKVLNRIKMPRIDNSDESYDYTIDNVIFSAEDILPENIRIEDTSVIELRNVSNEFQGDNPTNRIIIDIKKINFNVHEADLWFHRKSVPTLTDSGKMDIEVDKAGTDLRIVLNAGHALASVAAHLTGKKEAEILPLYSIDEVKCVVHNLHVKFKDTKHDTLYNLFTRLFPGVLKSRVQSVVENNVTRVLADFRYGIHTTLYKASNIATSITSMTGGMGQSPMTASASGTTYGEIRQPTTSKMPPAECTSENISEIRQPTVTSKMPPVEGATTAGERSTKM